ncbi:hypothetical protein O181_096968 [Austropuccinia psidii MF-1]|uniref:Reverse transcriptase domain-containing protein n=1 Tax=Austropuccinia psidii MF-1 TaxID=1389203 RepID=A0A9Q3PCQ2_9BASI|nr:hypothetical protein [Austropuccinia psidii MF-1]
MSRIGDWGERAYIHVYRTGLASRLLDQLASHFENFDSLQELIDITLELNTRYHERQKEKGSHQEGKPPISGSNSSTPPQISSSKKPCHRKNKKGNNFQESQDKPHSALINEDSKLIGSEKERRIKEGLCNYCGGKDEVFKEIKDVREDVAISSLHLFQGDVDLPPLSFHASLEEQWHEGEEPEEIETVHKVVPPAYHKYLDVFSKVKAEKLPPHCACDHHIELEGLLPPVGVIYSLSKNESETLRAYISENVEKGLIRPNSCSTGAPVLFVKKKDGGLCLCVDYCKLNAVTRKNRYTVPPMNQLLTVFNGDTIFSKIDLRGAYNLLRIEEGDEHLTAFRTKYGSYEYLVMPFGLTNAPASFQNLVNDIFADFLDIFVVVYLDDIMVFSSSQEEHVKHVASVLQRLRDNNLFAKASKCVFHASSVEYLSYVVSSEGLKMDSSKVQQILSWPQPKNIKALQSFLGFANFYRRFIKNYSKKVSALTSLFKKDSPFIFNEDALSQFQILKEAFTTAPILFHFNPSLPTIVETDASDYALCAVLSQVNDSGEHPIAFDSCKLLPAELNYEIHDKELLGIVWALKRWRAFLLSLSDSFEVLTDHSSLQYFMSSQVLTCCQARWAEFLSEFLFSITYRPGRLATLPDALSRRDDVCPERGVDFISKNP